MNLDKVVCNCMNITNGMIKEALTSEIEEIVDVKLVNEE